LATEPTAADAAEPAEATGATFIASRRSVICTFIVFNVDSVMRWTSSAWMVVLSILAFCSSQNCTVFSSSMRFCSSSGFNVGATHWPMLGNAEPAFFTRPCRKSNPGTSLAKFGMSDMETSSVAAGQ
jgi:hypothetical protein